MSGGSFNYLCYKDADELFAMMEELYDMAEYLHKLGYAEGAARETIQIHHELRDFMAAMNKRVRRIHDVWQAVEWVCSNDWGEDRIKKAVAAFDKVKQ